MSFMLSQINYTCSLYDFFFSPRSSGQNWLAKFACKPNKSLYSWTHTQIIAMINYKLRTISVCIQNKPQISIFSSLFILVFSFYWDFFLFCSKSKIMFYRLFYVKSISFVIIQCSQLIIQKWPALNKCKNHTEFNRERERRNNCSNFTAANFTQRSL